jgi:hypothetical protein
VTKASERQSKKIVIAYVLIGCARHEEAARDKCNWRKIQDNADSSSNTYIDGNGEAPVLDERKEQRAKQNVHQNARYNQRQA